jgi:hypothetical protein
VDHSTKRNKIIQLNYSATVIMLRNMMNPEGFRPVYARVQEIGNFLQPHITVTSPTIQVQGSGIPGAKQRHLRDTAAAFQLQSNSSFRRALTDE